MNERFIRYLKCVGTGAKHNRDLSGEEMADAMTMMLEGSAEPEQIAAFLLGWRLKPESTEEFRAALAVLDSYTKKVPVEKGLELGYPFDGKADNPYLFHLAAAAVAPFGIRPVVYTGELQPSKNGLSVKEACDALDLPANLVRFDRKNYAPALAALTPVRQKLGLRTGLNTLERLPHVGGCDTAVIGVFHKPYVKKYIKIFGDRYERLIILKGNEGTPEIFGKCRLWVYEKGETEEIVVDPAKFGVTYRKSFERISKEEAIAQMREPDEALVKLAKFNAALWLFAKNEAATIAEGWEKIDV
ncbi:glycosyl transferase [Hydrogenimonas sp. SS33]|uniref:glycosyl transferase n=1 Tax=Hydrogenimonas leucolamina TaxID=2954236 RepID=UPI00336BDF1A